MLPTCTVTVKDSAGLDLLKSLNKEAYSYCYYGYMLERAAIDGSRCLWHSG
jgi:hypothetical protein